MPYVPMLVYVHILLMVFWIGTDIGVYIAGLRFIDPRLSIAERSAVINVGLVIDRYPRICFVAIVPVGLQLSRALGLLDFSAPTMTLVWILCALWMMVVIAGMVLLGKPQARPWHRVERVFHVAALLGFAAGGYAGLTGRVSMPGWLAGKLAAYAAICLFAIMLERAFPPVMAAFAGIVADGSTAERESTLRRHMMKSYFWVLAIYAGVLVSGFLGTVQP